MPEPAPSYTPADTWHLNNRVNLLLLDRLTEEQLALTPAPRARSIAEQIAHLHAVRLSWLEVQAPAVAKSLGKLAKGAGKAALAEALEASGKAMGDVLAGAEKGGKLKSAKRGAMVFLGYLLAHEAHHRGQILLHLKHAGMPVDREFSYSLWEWEKI